MNPTQEETMLIEALRNISWIVNTSDANANEEVRRRARLALDKVNAVKLNLQALNAKIEQFNQAVAEYEAPAIASVKHPVCEGCGNPATTISADEYDLCELCYREMPASRLAEVP